MARFKAKNPPEGWAVIPFEGKYMAAQVVKTSGGLPAQIMPLLAEGDNNRIALFQYRWQAVNAANGAAWWHGTKKTLDEVKSK